MAQSLVGKRIGNYEVTKLLGEGGMGAVFLGEHPLIGKKVAIKVLHEELAKKEEIVSRFFTEAKSVNDIGHEHIVDVVDFGKIRSDAGDIVYFIMEHLDGDSLSGRLKNGGVTQEETLHIMSQAASALAASHAKGIVHRDIKPDNIYLITRGADRNFVKLLDFGIAKLTGESNEAGITNRTRAGSVLGTPAYMSPEQCDGQGNIDNRSDIYSLGIVMYEMLVGRVPFVGEGFGEILVAQITLPPTPPSALVDGVSPEIEAIVMRCLEKNRDLRYQTMDEMKEAIDALIAPAAPAVIVRPQSMINQVIDEEPPPGVLTTSNPTTLQGAASEARPLGRPSSKTPLWLGLASVLVIGGGVGGFVMLRKPPPPPVVQAPPPPPKVEKIRVLLDSTPQGAKITRAGQAEPIGVTPKEIELKKGDPAFDLVFSFDGHKPSTRTITSDRDREVLVALDKVEAAPPPVEKVEKPKPVKLPRAPRGGGEFKPVGDRSSDPDGVLAPSL